MLSSVIGADAALVDCGRPGPAPSAAAAAGPRWASANLGIFMCIRCSGIHRNLGVHISFVRSVSLDEWKASQVENMVRWGNRRANEYWEAGVPEDYYIPDENDPVQQVER